MDITLAGGAVAYTPNDDQLGGLSIEFAAFDGEVGTGILPISDDTAVITVPGGRACRIEEGATRLTDGFVIDQDRDRGPNPTGRQYNFGFMDANALLDGFRVHRLRPSETDVARVLYFAGIDGPAWDTTWVLNSDTVTMPKKLYDSDGGWTAELIPDLVEFTGKTLFLHDKADGSGRCLHYHVLTTGHTSGLAISDVIADVNGVTVFFPGNPSRSRTSIDLRNSVRGRDQNNRRYTAADGTSISDHDADGLQHEALIDFETTGAADLRVKTQAMLASTKNELNTYTCDIGPLDETALAKIRVGDFISTTSGVFGLGASSQRIAHMTLKPVIGAGGRARPGWWNASLELGRPIRRRARVKARKPPVIAPPFVEECDVEETVVDNFNRANGALGTASGGLVWDTVATPVISGNRMLVAESDDDAHLDFGSLPLPTGVTFEFEPIGALAFDTGFYLDNADLYFLNTDEVQLFYNSDWPGVTVPFTFVGGTVYKVRLAVLDGTIKAKVWELADAEPGPWNIIITDPVNSALDHTTQFGVVTGVPFYLDNLTMFGGCSEPFAGQTVREVIGSGDGVQTLFHTSVPYRASSMQLSANGLPEHDFTETDPDAMEVTFGTAPFLGEVIRAEYQAQ